MAHVNLMTDTVIANLPPDGLRSVMRSLLASNPDITQSFESNVKQYLQQTSISRTHTFFKQDGHRWSPTESFFSVQARIRAMLGCGLSFESLVLLKFIVAQSIAIPSDRRDDALMSHLAALEGDVIQCVTAIEKVQAQRALTEHETYLVRELYSSLVSSYNSSKESRQRIAFGRSVDAVGSILGMVAVASKPGSFSTVDIPKWHDDSYETFELDGKTLPRLFTGLWQLSSPSWGVASEAEIFDHFFEYVSRGFTAYDMADHYGDAEVLFGKFRASCPNAQQLFASTKFCVFRHVTVTPQFVHDNISERCARLQSETVDLLQFHWQFYEDKQYIKALELLQADKRVKLLGLCNFDTERMIDILEANISIVSNQVQFSLIDSRPTVKMAEVCKKHNVKLLTYGTLCGGFLAEKWLGQRQPDLYSNDITPSQRKYFEMITTWGGWDLFQELLRALKTIGEKHKVSITNVATRWVLDFPYVGAVIVGARMGVSGHAEENLACYGWRLDQEDQAIVEGVLGKSRREEVFNLLGDCGGEYRK